MRSNGIPNSNNGGGVAAGVYPYIVKAQLRDQAGFENFRDGTVTQAQLVPTNFAATPQTAINTAVTDVATKYTRGNNLYNTAESRYYRFGSWVNAERLKNLYVAPVGKTFKAITHALTAYSKSIMVGTDKILTVWSSSNGTTQNFWCIIGTKGANGMTWGTEQQIGTLAAATANGQPNRWVIAKANTDKAVIFFSDNGNSDRFSATCFSISGTNIDSVGGNLQITTDASVTLYSACYAAADKVIVSSAVATDKAYCLTASTVTLTAGSGLQISTATSTGSVNFNLTYISDDKVLMTANETTVYYSAILTVATRTITLNAETTLSGMTTTTNSSTILMSSAMAVMYGNNTANNTSVGEIVIGSTTTTMAKRTVTGTTSGAIALGADIANSEVYIWGGTTAGFNRLTISGGAIVTKNGLTTGVYVPKSADVQLDHSAAYVASYAQLSLGDSVACFVADSGAGGLEIYYQFISTQKPIIKVNGVTVHTASTATLGGIYSLDADLTNGGYAEIELVNNLGAPCAMMPDEALITCT